MFFNRKVYKKTFYYKQFYLKLNSIFISNFLSIQKIRPFLISFSYFIIIQSKDQDYSSISICSYTFINQILFKFTFLSQSRISSWIWPYCLMMIICLFCIVLLSAIGALSLFHTKNAGTWRILTLSFSGI